MPASISAGPDRALVQLAGGEYLAVDTGSIDSVPYLLGLPVEPHALFVFRCFLKPQSVVLDIGAHFGLYSAVAGPVVAGRGALYAFEGNPRSFACLARTFYANRLNGRPDILAVNMLVSDRCGRGTLYYAENALSGGTMTAIGDTAARDFAKIGLTVRTVENEMTTIDDFLPSDRAVDLVKIDTEGHEPFVVRGMARTIARSPQLRFIIELDETFLARTVPAEQFLDEIGALGFRACRILRHSALAPVAQGERVTGPCELLLTRTPEADIRTVAAARRRLPVRLKRWIRTAAGSVRDLRHHLA
jgi:FkbM family methyltransferase